MKLLLSDVLVNILDEEVSLLIKFALGVSTRVDDAELLSLKLSVVHSIQTSVSFLFVSELKIAVTTGLGCFTI
jgi:hypothetical protein